MFLFLVHIQTCLCWNKTFLVKQKKKEKVKMDGQYICTRKCVIFKQFSRLDSILLDCYIFSFILCSTYFSSMKIVDCSIQRVVKQKKVSEKWTNRVVHFYLQLFERGVELFKLHFPREWQTVRTLLYAYFSTTT